MLSIERTAERAVSERPILFSGPMVRAILEDRKSQTRRVIKPQPPVGTRSVYRPFAGEPNNWQGARRDLMAWYGRCPYGQEGDRLWVRETWTGTWTGAGLSTMHLHYAADGGEQTLNCDPAYVLPKAAAKVDGWVTPLFMPRWASRILLEVIEVRAQRLQEISENDAAGEGVGVWFETHPHPGWDGDPDEHRKGFAELWDAINGKSHPWAGNPWVWAVTFKRILA